MYANLNTKMMNLEGKEITGTYYGKPFAGTVVSTRQTAYNYAEQINVKLSTPIVKPGNHICGENILIISTDVKNRTHTIDQI